MLKLNPDALSIMKWTSANGKLLPFEITYVEADRKRDKGGRVVTLDRVYISDKKSGSIKGRYINVRPVGTRDFVRIHLDLILYLNGEAVA